MESNFAEVIPMTTFAPHCLTCDSVLEARSEEDFDMWSCTKGHGLAVTMSEAHVRFQEDEIQQLWRASKDGEQLGTKCAMCSQPLVRASVGVDDDESFEGAAGDGENSTSITAEICRTCQFIWLSTDELNVLPADLPDEEMAVEAAAALQQVQVETVAALDQAWAERDEQSKTEGMYRFLVKLIPALRR